MSELDIREPEADGSNEEQLTLSAETFAALNEFLAEQKIAQEQAIDDPFREIWGLSQFWYTEETASVVAKEVVTAAQGGRIACLACPSLFRQLLKEYPEAQAHLFEYDPRFEVLGNFTLYDYNHPADIADGLKGQFAVVVADPPYLAEECLEKTSQTMRLLAAEEVQPKFYLLTGATMRYTAYQLLGVRPVVYRPQHKNKLGNEFLLYTNVLPSASIGPWDPEVDPVQERSNS